MALPSSEDTSSSATETRYGRESQRQRCSRAQALLGRSGKIDANFAVTFHSTWTVTLPVALLGAGYLLYAAPGGLRALAQRVPPIRAALAGLAVLAVLGFALNDSGIAVPGMMLGVVVPALVVLAVRSDQVFVEPAGTDPDADDEHLRELVRS